MAVYGENTNHSAEHHQRENEGWDDPFLATRKLECLKKYDKKHRWTLKRKPGKRRE